MIGRAKLSNVEMDDDVKPSNSHVALNTIIEADGTQRQILRENMPFGSLGAGEFGTYFIGYAGTPSVTELMLQHMFLGDPPGNYDRILDFSTAVTGTLFFVPTADFLDDPPRCRAMAKRRPLRHEEVRRRAPPAGDGSLGIGGPSAASVAPARDRRARAARRRACMGRARARRRPAVRRGLLERALSVVAARLERQPQPATRRRGRAAAPGRALDVGCGEGADAIWLAQHGWDVMATDISSVALERAARHAADTVRRPRRASSGGRSTFSSVHPSPTPSTSSRPSSCSCHRGRGPGCSLPWPLACGREDRCWWSVITRRTWPPGCAGPRCRTAFYTSGRHRRTARRLLERRGARGPAAAGRHARR